MTANTSPGRIWLTVFTGNSGLTHYSFCLARALAESGVDASLITNVNYELDIFGGGFPVRKIFGRTRRYPLDILRYWFLFRRERPAIVHYQAFLKFPALELVLLKLQKRSGARLVYTAHDWLPHRRRGHHPLLFRLYYRQFDRIIVHTRRGAHFLEEELAVDPEKIVVIPHGEYGIFDLDPGMTREDAREKLGLDPAVFWFLFFGYIEDYKGLDIALGALGRLLGEQDGGPPVGLIIAGNPRNLSFEPFAWMIRELGLGERVSLNIGHIPITDVQLYFKAADALVLPYRESSTSGLAHVAMGFGKPVIATDVGGLKETVEDGRTGLVVTPDDEAELAAAMRKMAGDPGLAARLGQGWSEVEEKYSWDNIAGKTAALYGSLSG